MKEIPSSAVLIGRGSSLLRILTTLIVIVFVVFSLAIVFFFFSSQDRMINQSKEKFIQSEVDYVTSTVFYIANNLIAEFEDQVAQNSFSDTLNALADRQLLEAQKWLNSEISRIVDEGVMGIENVLAILDGSPVSGNTPVVIASNDEGYLWDWPVPGFFIDAIAQSRKSSQGIVEVLKEDGIPEMGLDGEQLIIFVRIQSPIATTYLVVVTSLQEKVNEISSFYSQERKRSMLFVSLAVGISILVIILISFFVLSYLLRRRITDPINELSAGAEKIMEGNLDIEIPVRPGEELEKLKIAFNKMVESLRKMIERSVGED